MGKTICCNCNKELGWMQFKFSKSELWDISSHPKVTTMDSNDKLCGACKKLYEEEINPTPKDIQIKNDIEPENVTKTSNFTKSLNFCPKCGHEVIEQASFCVGCGLDIVNLNTEPKRPPQVSSSPAQEVKITKSQSWASKFQLVMGIIAILSGAYTSNSFNVFLGIVLVITGFVSLKNKSKTVDQFLTIVSFIILAIIFINWFK